MGCLFQILGYAVWLLALGVSLAWAGIKWGFAHLDIVITVFTALFVIGFLNIHQYHPAKRRLTLLIACAVFYWTLSQHQFFIAAAICLGIEIVMTGRQWKIIIPARRFAAQLDAIGYANSDSCDLSDAQKIWLAEKGKAGHFTFQSTEYLISN